MSQFASRLKKWRTKNRGHYDVPNVEIFSVPYFKRNSAYESEDYLERQRKLSAIRAELQQTEGHFTSDAGSSELIKEVLSQSPAQSLAEVIDEGTYIDMNNGVYVETENKEPDYEEIAENEPLYYSPAQSLAEVIDDGTYIDMNNGVYVETENKEPDYAEIAENEPLYEEIGPSSQLLRTSSAESPPAVNYDSLWALIARKGMQSEKVKK